MPANLPEQLWGARQQSFEVLGFHPIAITRNLYNDTEGAALDAEEERTADESSLSYERHFHAAASVGRNKAGSHSRVHKIAVQDRLFRVTQKCMASELMVFEMRTNLFEFGIRKIS